MLIKELTIISPTLCTDTICLQLRVSDIKLLDIFKNCQNAVCLSPTLLESLDAQYFQLFDYIHMFRPLFQNLCNSMITTMKQVSNKVFLKCIMLFFVSVLLWCQDLQYNRIGIMVENK